MASWRRAGYAARTLPSATPPGDTGRLLKRDGEQEPARPKSRAEEIAERLRRELAAEHVEIEDESHRHAGHPGAQGGGHFNVLVVSERFVGLDRLARQRAVYAALQGQLGTAIHALSARTLTPDEWRRRPR